MEPPPNKNETESERQEADGESPPQGNSVPPTNPSKAKDGAGPSGHKPQRRKRRYRRWTKPQVVVNGALALLGGIGIVIYYLQLEEMRKSTDAATKAAKAAEDSVTLARESALIDQRPWINVTAPRLMKQLVAGEKPKIGVELINTGRTPAFYMELSGVVFVPSEEVTPYQLAEAQTFDEKSISVTILPPGRTASSIFDVDVSPITQPQIDDIRSGKRFLYVAGVVRYVDVSGGTHVTKFCSRKAGSEIDAAEVFMEACPSGNTSN